MNVLEQKIDLHSKESASTHILIADEIFEIKAICLKIAEQDPEAILKFVQTNSEELKKILSSLEKSLSNFDLAKAKTASNWKIRVEKGIGITADVIALITFIIGIPSLPAFVDPQTSKRIMNLFRELSQKISL